MPNTYTRPSRPGSDEAMLERLRSYKANEAVVAMATSGLYFADSIASRSEPVSLLYDQIDYFIDRLERGIGNYYDANTLVTKLELNLKYYHGLTVDKINYRTANIGGDFDALVDFVETLDDDLEADIENIKLELLALSQELQDVKRKQT